MASLLGNSGVKWARRSGVPSATDHDCEVVLLDTVGELRALYPLAGIVFVGGSIATAGGHNMLEPAAHGACIVTGPHTSNFSAIVSAFLSAGALVQLPEVSKEAISMELANTLSQLLTDHARRRRVGEKARALCESGRGATQRTLELLAPILTVPADNNLAAPRYTGQPALVSK